MRKMTLSDIKSKINSTRSDVDYSVQLFRAKSQEQGWSSHRTRPRNPDEIKALNYIARQTIRAALQEGTLRYDKEKRVLSIDKFTES